MDELTHGSTEGGHFGFPASDEALIEPSNIGVILGRHHGGHIKRGAQAGVSGFGEARPFQDAGARLMFNGHQSHIGGRLRGAGEGSGTK